MLPSYAILSVREHGRVQQSWRLAEVSDNAELIVAAFKEIGSDEGFRY
jgi:hypothetical protein